MIAAAALAATAGAATGDPCGSTNAVGKSWVVHSNGFSCSTAKATVRRLTGLPGARAFLKAHKNAKVKAAYRLPTTQGMSCSLSYLPHATTQVLAKLVVFCFDIHTAKGVVAETVT